MDNTRDRPAPNNLPSQLTRFIGRERDLSAIRTRLLGPTSNGQESPEGTNRPERLLTLTGVGGCGKTRLALEVAQGLATPEKPVDTLVFDDGLWWIEMAPLTDPAQVSRAVAAALGLRDTPDRTATEALIQTLRPKSTLLIWDNCEHLTRACAQLAGDLIRTCPRLSILCTSRAPLDLDGESLFPVLPLEVVNLDARTPPTNLAPGEAVRLFVDRAASALPGYRLNADNAAAITQICRRLDGLPLAIELAARWVRVLSAQDIAVQIDHSLDFLATTSAGVDERHRSMRAVLDHSWRLLDEAERVALAVLSIFRGGFSREAADTVAGATLPVLAGLVDKSLLQRIPYLGGSTRYTLHELVRQYAEERLQDAGEGQVEPAHERHLGYFLALCERAEQAWDTPQEAEWLQRLKADQDNIRQALRWAIDHGRVEAALRMNAALFTFWIYASSAVEAAQWLDAALSLPWDESVTSLARARAKALSVAGYAAIFESDFATATACFEEGLALYKRLDDRRGITWSLRGCGFAATLRGDAGTAKPYVEQSLALCRQAQDDWGVAWSMHDLGEIELSRGDLKQAQALLEEGLAWFDRLRIEFGCFCAYLCLGLVHQRLANWRQTLVCYREALVLQEQNNYAALTGDALEGLAWVAVALNHPTDAARVLGMAASWREIFGIHRWRYREPDYERCRRETQARLGAGWQAEWNAGRALPVKQAIAEALLLAETLAAEAEASASPALLTDREAMVLRLLAQGHSNQAIADQLVISRRTVHAHVRSIFGKLDVSTRTAAAHEATRLGLM